MSGFDPRWLALREPADHAARSPDLLRALADRLDGRESIRVIDLGCGTGSNLRGTAAALPARQSWTLVDWDPLLLAAAKERLRDFAAPGKTVAVETRQADLMQDLDAVLAQGAELVTAAAFFDLVSSAWIETFAATLAARRLPLYTVLTYDGREAWSPPHPLDEAVLAAFHAHQGRDKGFGPAAGPAATRALQQAFERQGYRVRTAQSPWRLDAAREPDLVGQLAAGIAAAAAETGVVTPAEARAWADARRTAQAEIGHWDLLAWPE